MKRLVLLLTIASFLTACNRPAATKESEAETTVDNIQNNGISILYFHGKKRCVTCNAIESLSQEVADSLATENVTMRIIDISKKENQQIAAQYQITWSSLLLEYNGQVIDLTETGFGYAKNQPDVFKAKLTEAIRKIQE